MVKIRSSEDRLPKASSIALASAWYPRGELSRFLRLLPILDELYVFMAISLPPEAEQSLVAELEEISENISVVPTLDWSWGRYVALQWALESSTSHVHYVDFDRLLRWVETRPDEWRQTMDVLVQNDCLIMGRTESAYQTHPQALLRTEAISNMVTSYLLGKEMDFSAGSKGFYHLAAEYLISNCTPGHALGTDAAWPLALHRAGFEIEYIEVNGLDWEIPDQHQSQAADLKRQQRQAREYDDDPAHWAQRVEVALEIVQEGLTTIQLTNKDRKK